MGSSHHVFENLCHLSQALIALGMSIVIVIGFEMINIEQD